MRAILPLLAAVLPLSGCMFLWSTSPQAILSGGLPVDLHACMIPIWDSPEARAFAAKSLTLADGRPAFTSFDFVGSLEQGRQAGCDFVFAFPVEKGDFDKVSMFSSRTPAHLLMKSARTGAVLAKIDKMTYYGSEIFHDVYSSVLPGTQAYATIMKERGTPSRKPVQAAAQPMAKAEPASEVDAPSYRVKEDPTKYALVVGIEKYSHAPEASYAESDAKAMRRHLLAMGYPERNVIMLAGSEATGGAIKKYVETWLPNVARDASTVFVYYSGHGAPDPISGQAYLVPWDGDPKFLKDTAYPVSQLYDRLHGLKAKHVVVALDACFSGAGGRSILAKGIRPLVNKIVTGSVAPPVVALSASEADQISGGLDDQRHGAFTYYMLKGLNEGHGSLTDLYGYVRPRVADAARRDNRDQVPQLSGDAAGVVLR